MSTVPAGKLALLHWVGIEPRRAHWVMKRHSHVSSGPPAIPEGRISRFRFWPWLFPRGLSKTGEAQALARIHPTHFGLPLDSSFNHGSSDLRRWPYGDRQVPRAPLPVTSVTRGRGGGRATPQNMTHSSE